VSGPPTAETGYGLPAGALDQILGLLQSDPAVETVLLYGSRALGRQRPGSDIDLCLVAPTLGLGELLQLQARLDDLLLPWAIDLQLHHKIDHPPLLEHIDRVGIRLRAEPPPPDPPGAAAAPQPRRQPRDFGQSAGA